MESAVTENYLKAVFNAAEWSDEPLTVGALASRLGLSPSSTSEQVRKLTTAGLLTHERYGVIGLTERGRRIALSVVRKHRLIETFLVSHLGYTWDEVHDEAEVLEHAVSDVFIARLATLLADPATDPHGDPIPRDDGTLPDHRHRRLSEIATGTRVVVARVWDDDPSLLRLFDELGLTIGTELEVGIRHEAAGTVSVHLPDRTAVLGLPAAAAIRVAAAR